MCDALPGVWCLVLEDVQVMNDDAVIVLPSISLSVFGLETSNSRPAFVFLGFFLNKYLCAHVSLGETKNEERNFVQQTRLED